MNRLRGESKNWASPWAKITCAAQSGERAGYIYGRTRNPTQAILEERIASLESGEAAMTAASGMAAISSTMLSLLQAGDEVIVDHTL